MKKEHKIEHVYRQDAEENIWTCEKGSNKACKIVPNQGLKNFYSSADIFMFVYEE